MTILILGGTAEARALATALGGQAVLSLAGVTKRPLRTPHRTGGFGGTDGLAGYLVAQKIAALVDATHPFASQISQNAAKAAARTRVPILRLNRAAWRQRAEWQDVADMETAASALPRGARAFLSIGSRSLAPFLPREDVWFLTRSIEPPNREPTTGEVILARPPFSMAAETALMEQHKITHLVSKNVGGSATEAKLKAASALGVTVIMVKRPRLPDVFEVESVAQALKWVENPGG